MKLCLTILLFIPIWFTIPNIPTHLSCRYADRRSIITVAFIRFSASYFHMMIIPTLRAEASNIATISGGQALMTV